MNALLLVLLCMLVLSCASGDKRKLVVYSPHGKEMLTEYEKQYEELHPEVDVQWLDMGSQDVLDRIRTERQNPQADLWWGAPSMTFAAAEAEGLLEPLVPTWDEAISAELKSPQHHWYGNFVTPEVIMYNNRVIPSREAPQDWDDLLDAKWRDKVIIRYPLASGTMRIIFSSLILREQSLRGTTDAGFDWLRRLDANTKTYAADPTQLYLKIAREEGLVTLWNLPDVVIQVQTNGYPFGYVIPKSGTPLITDCIAIVKGTKNREEAERFYEFVTSREALVYQAHHFHRIPARDDIGPEELPAWIATLDVKPMPLDWKMITEHERSWMKYWDERIKGTGRY